MMHRLCAILMFVATLASSQDAQPTIRVEVKSGEAVIQDAEVIADQHNGRTGSDGVVVLPAALRRVEIRVMKEGFFPARTTLDIGSAKEWAVQIDLQPQEEREEKVTVYATRNDVRVQDSPLHVEVVSQDEINEELAMRSSDISMLLNEMGGMRVQTTSPGLGAASIRIQGMIGRYTAFLSDGLPLFGQQGAGLGLLQLPPMDLAQVEVIKGNSSALYGSAAMAGVVNLISRRPTKEPVHEFLFNRSSLGGTDGSIFLASQLTPHWGASLLGGAYFQEHRT
jgi:iron complex outermembrane receptor protein